MEQKESKKRVTSSKSITSKITLEMKKKVQRFLAKNIEQAQNDFMTLEPKEKIAFLTMLIKFDMSIKIDGGEANNYEYNQPAINIIIDGKEMNLIK